MADTNRISIGETDAANVRALRVVIVGGGFGGLAAAKALRKAPVQVILIDRTNHHLFQPLLYQVATSVLSPSQISSPIRGILRKQKNTTVVMGEVTGVDKEQRCVFVNSPDREHVPVHYDYLILATGARHSYFGHTEFEKFAPGLKRLAHLLFEIRCLRLLNKLKPKRIQSFIRIYLRSYWSAVAQPASKWLRRWQCSCAPRCARTFGESIQPKRGSS
jgi:NADH dehydrogenase FAD-containing subunit